MTKILNFGLKIKGGGRESGTCEVLRPCQPPPQKKIETCTRGVAATLFSPRHSKNFGRGKFPLLENC